MYVHVAIYAFPILEAKLLYSQKEAVIITRQMLTALRDEPKNACMHEG